MRSDKAWLRSIPRTALDASLPLAAIGGISLTNAAEVIAAGADMICAISEVITHADVCARVEKFQKLFIL